MEEQTAAVVKGNSENDSNGSVNVNSESSLNAAAETISESTSNAAQADKESSSNGAVNAGEENNSNGGTKMSEQVNTQSNVSLDTANIEAMLKRIEKANKKQLAWARIAAIFMILLFVVIGGALFKVVPRVIDTLNNINVAVSSANEVLEQANAAISDINQMSRSLTTTSDELSKMLSENSEALASAIAQIEAIDFESLNNAIVDLETTVGPLADFMGRFSKK